MLLPPLLHLISWTCLLRFRCDNVVIIKHSFLAPTFADKEVKGFCKDPNKI